MSISCLETAPSNATQTVGDELRNGKRCQAGSESVPPRTSKLKIWDGKVIGVEGGADLALKNDVQYLSKNETRVSSAKDSEADVL